MLIVAPAISPHVDSCLIPLFAEQKPIVRPAAYDTYSVDQFPMGTNAIVAVISYTVRLIDDM